MKRVPAGAAVIGRALPAMPRPVLGEDFSLVTTRQSKVRLIVRRGRRIVLS